MRTVRVLSLDWDWFFDYGTDGGKEALLPDPRYECCGREVLCSVFADAYLAGRNGKRLTELSVDRKKLTSVRRILTGIRRAASVVIRESHAALYGWLTKQYPDAAFSVVHFDHHHDFYELREGTPDSGSWASALYLENRLSQCLWVKNPSSILTVNDSGKLVTDLISPKTLMVTDDFADISGDFDVIFFCRSWIWAPPHADRAFSELANEVLAVPSEETDVCDAALDGMESFYPEVVCAAGEKSLEAVMRGYLPADVAAERFVSDFLPRRTQEFIKKVMKDPTDTAQGAYEFFADEYREYISSKSAQLRKSVNLNRADAYRSALSSLYKRENK